MTSFISPLAPAEAWRPQLHYSARGNWINDPNGLFYKDGVYHLYYQMNPDDSVWGNMHWGHAVSTDLLRWQELPIALDAEPEGLGYAFSGGAVIDWNNSSGLGDGVNPPIIATYTQHSKDAVQVQSIAYSTDGGKRFVPYAGNPVIANPGLKDFRDPKVVWHEPSQRWVMALVAGDRAHFYTSTNLREWTFASEFGAEHGAHGGVWECPELFSLTCAETGESRWILTISLNPGGPNGGSAMQYFVGQFDGQVFQVEHQDTRWLDFGTDFYAGITWDGLQTMGDERVMIAWMSNWQYANKTPTDSWRGAMSLPRRMALRKVDGHYRVASEPHANLLAARHAGFDWLQDRPLGVGELLSTKELPPVAEIVLQLRWSAAAPVLEWQLINAQGEQLSLVLDAAEASLSLDRRQSGWDQEGFGRAMHAELYATAPGMAELRLFVDRSSIEVFANGGLTCVTSCCFPQSPYSTLQLHLRAGALDAVSAQIYHLE
ncbi:glycoside hydrolase family 32 protein [Cellvibrio fontiphilus]|uniref:Glycoside hydrolase family 32 protein n=1 Tax=Cellvibrio fontiphilus TaxID=1815559 RepID=A0ABV7FJK4_9GAMM